MKIKWSGLADANYYEYIAKYCLPSWENLPGEKYIVHDKDLITLPFLNIVDEHSVLNLDSPFKQMERERKKTNNFWRKMQSQVWAVRNIKDCDFLILLDTDIEVFDFNFEKLKESIIEFKETNYVWASGMSQRNGHDSGFIIFNMHHPDLNTLIDEYENIWNSGRIYELEKSYDGHAVESMFNKWPSYKLKNIDWGDGFHVYHGEGLVHYGSVIPKQLRSQFVGTGIDLVKKYTENKIIKPFKDSYLGKTRNQI